MAFCPNCGANNFEGANNCANCGTPLSMGYTPQKKNNAGLVAGIIAAVIAFVAIIVVLVSAGNSPETPVKNLIKAMNTCDATYLEKVVPEVMYDKLIERNGMDIEEGLEWEKKIAEDEYGTGEFKYEIIRKKKIEKDELEDVEENLEEIYEEEGLKAPRVSAGYDMRVELIYEGSKETDSETDTMSVYKINGKWYILGF